ncbi:hypothetical protein GCM10009647_005500 [Streptomyces sanglieri]
MVTVSKTPEPAVAVVEHPRAARVTWLPGVITDGVTVNPVAEDAPPDVAAYAVADGAVRARAAAPSRATGATPIARMGESSGSPRSTCGTSFHKASEMHLDAPNARSRA